MKLLDLRKVLYILLVVFTIGGHSQAFANFGPERIVVLDFLALDEQGNYIDTLHVKTPDLTNLSRVMTQGIAARLVQHGEFDIQDGISLKDDLYKLNISTEASSWERAKMVMDNDLAEQVITGTITMLQTTVAVSAQRFQNRDGQMVLVGSSMNTTPKIAEAATLVDSLVTALFPSDVQVIERTIDQVFAVPSQMRLNLGQSKKLEVYALDSLGRPVTNPEFLFFSSEESKVEVDEQGIVKGIQPGSSTITIRAISRTSRSGTPATMNVLVLPPTFGIRVGSLLTKRNEGNYYPRRLGLRITPTIEQSGQKGTQQATKQDSNATSLPMEATPNNPLAVIASYFGSMLTNGLMTIDFDLDPTREILLAFNGVQRSSTGYIGTGVGYVSPMDDFGQQKGFVLRFTLGTQHRLGNRLSIPLEAVVDAIFPTSTAFSPSLRVGINLGLDLYP